MHHTSNHVEMWGYAPEKHPKRMFTQPDRAEKTTIWELMQAKKPAGMEWSESLSTLQVSLAFRALVFAH
jgi:hypothetical protein